MGAMVDERFSLDSIEAACDLAWAAYGGYGFEVENLIMRVARQAGPDPPPGRTGDRISRAVLGLTHLLGICALRVFRFAHWACPDDRRLAAALARTVDTEPWESGYAAFADGSSVPWMEALDLLGDVRWLAELSETYGSLGMDADAHTRAAAVSRLAETPRPIWAAPDEADQRRVAKEIARDLLLLPEWEPEGAGVLMLEAILRLYEAYRTYCVHIQMLLEGAQQAWKAPINLLLLRLGLASALRVVASALEAQALAPLFAECEASDTGPAT